MESRQVLLRRRPTGMPSSDDFEMVTVEVPEPAEGQVRVRNLCMSVDPYMRGRMMDRKSYAPPWQVGQVMEGAAVGVVVDSAHPDFAPGDYVSSGQAWREAFTAGAEGLRNLGKDVPRPSAHLGILGGTGLTAYVGLFEIGNLQEGETVFVSGAAGAVGSIAGQIAKLKGCRVIGSAGSDEKVRWLQHELGFDTAFNYREGSIADHVREAAPDGLDLYFDNVGGEHLRVALANMRKFGRIVLCGMIGQYNATEPVAGPDNLLLAIGQNLTLRGFIVSNYPHLYGPFHKEMSGWIEQGLIKDAETVIKGIEHATDAFIALFSGANTGKMVVDLARQQPGGGQSRSFGPGGSAAQPMT